MTYDKAIALPMAVLFAAVLGVFSFAPGAASANAKFQKWVQGFEGVARKNGIRRSTFRRAFAGVTAPDPEVLELARYQPEFRQKLWMYFDSRVNEETIARGQLEKQNWASWLSRIERKYGIDRHILLAIWSMESGYGEALKRPRSLRSVIRSLATLAYADRRRRKFARRQLIAAMKILQSGAIGVEQLRGSWAGAMGHTQFIPTSYRAYAQNIDGKPGADIWNSVPDALATAARLLQKAGWRTGRTWGYEVTVPARLRNQAGKQRTIRSWANLGARRVGGRSFSRTGENGVLMFPAGENGPAFLMLRNFFVIKRYNNSDKYALAVGHLADQIAGFGDFKKPVPRPFRRLSLDERIELQSLLKKMGLYDLDIDGKIGGGTRSAIRKAQIKFGLNPTGVESPKFLATLRRRS
ncbi:MAG: lytic murein transglycosylase [Ahrensia sp.]|nr:lytic murein transglycosylase [Ahrensia sp.]